MPRVRAPSVRAEPALPTFSAAVARHAEQMPMEPRAGIQVRRTGPRVPTTDPAARTSAPAACAYRRDPSYPGTRICLLAWHIVSALPLALSGGRHRSRETNDHSLAPTTRREAFHFQSPRPSWVNFVSACPTL